MDQPQLYTYEWKHIPTGERGGVVAKDLHFAKSIIMTVLKGRGVNHPLRKDIRAHRIGKAQT